MATVWRDMRTRGRPAWCILYKGLDGKWHRERTEARTKEQAQAILAKKTDGLITAKLTGVSSVEALKPRTFGEFVTHEYLPHCAATHTEKTYSGDLVMARILTDPFGPMQLRSIGTGDIQKYVDQEAGRILRPVRPARDENGKGRRTASERP